MDTEQTPSNDPPKTDNRGKHWGPKLAPGKERDFLPSDGTKKWAKHVEAIRAELTKYSNPLPEAPWDQKFARKCGNMKQYFYWLIQLCADRGYVSVTKADSIHNPNSFYGIMTITFHNKEEFNKYKFPLLDLRKQGCVRTPEEEKAYKTIDAHWKQVGFKIESKAKNPLFKTDSKANDPLVETDSNANDPLVMTFSPEVFVKMQDQRKISDKKRRRTTKSTSAPTTNNTSALTTTFDPLTRSFLPVVKATPIDPNSAPGALVAHAVPYYPPAITQGVPIVFMKPVDNRLDLLATAAVGFVMETSVLAATGGAQDEKAPKRARK